MDETLSFAVLGTLTVFSEGQSVQLPPSRKTRALLGHLLLSGRPSRREYLCDMFWCDGPDDPRAALRWSLSKLRPIIDTPDAVRLIADREAVSIDQSGIVIDLRRAKGLLDAEAPVEGEIAAALIALREPVLAGLDLSKQDVFGTWLAAERAAAERLRRSLLHRFVTSGEMSHEDRLPWAREWLNTDPFNVDAAAQLQAVLERMGRGVEAKVVGRSFANSLAEAGLPPAPMAGAVVAGTRIAVGASGHDRLQRQRIQFCRASDGVRLAFASVGGGPPLVKSASWLNHLELDWDAPIWAPIFQELARDHRFIRYDERGNGMSEDQVADISFNAFVDDLETVVDAAGIDRFPLLGMSQGCAVAIEYAVRHPERVSHLILWGGYAAGWRIDATPDLIEEQEAIIALVRQGWGRTDAAYRQLVTATFMPSATVDELDWFNTFQRQTVTAANAARYLEVFADIDVRHRLKQVQAPTLVMHARGDRRIPIARGVHLAAEIPGAEFVALDSDNHLLLGREPASSAFVDHIRQFLGESASRNLSGAAPANIRSHPQLSRRQGYLDRASMGMRQISSEALPQILPRDRTISPEPPQDADGQRSGCSHPPEGSSNNVPLANSRCATF